MKVEKRNLNEALNYYKVIYDTAPPEKMIAFVLPHLLLNLHSILNPTVPMSREHYRL
ncbi:MAG: hypothetical protein IKB25_12685 [Lentisphaeria bacterium]|nr:hypothetical protein [Lentisphaeria bacterium]